MNQGEQDTKSLAQRLEAHFKRMALEPGWPIRAYHPTVRVRDGKVVVQPISFYPAYTLDAEGAARLLAWLDEGQEAGFWALITHHKEAYARTE